MASSIRDLVPTPRFANGSLSRLWRDAAMLAPALSAALLLSVATAHAEGLTVTTTADPGAGSLREAIERANASQGADTISFAPGVSGAIELGAELPQIASDLSVAGPGQGALTVRRALGAATDFRVFDIGNFTVSISGLTISNGRGLGAGIQSNGRLTLDHVTVSGNESVESSDAASGGGVFAGGSLVLRDSIVSGNVTQSMGADPNASSAGLQLRGHGEIVRSTISGNLAEASASAGEAGAFNAVQLLEGPWVIEQSTISGNVARAHGVTGAESEGAGAVLENTTVIGSTITGNVAEASTITGPVTVRGANVVGIHRDGVPDVVVRDSIVSNPKGGASCAGTLISGGFNIDDGASCGFNQPTDHSGVDPGLAPSLADNGGPTPTFALLPGSIAIDQGNAFGAATDQRGLARPSDFGAIANVPGGDGSDIGAFELIDATPPNTRIDHGPPHRARRHLAKFRFSSTEPASHFLCKLDKRRFKPCASPFKHKVKPGKHTFRVRAIDLAGNADPTPAKYVWRVKAKRHRHKHHAAR